MLKARENFSLFFLGAVLGLFFALPVYAEDLNQRVNEILEKALSDSDQAEVINNNIPADQSTNQSADSATENSNSTPTEDQTAKSETEGFISIESPKSHEVVVNTSAKILGKTMPNVLVEITIVDGDLHRKFIRHTNPARISGTTTSDKNGDWVYVPQYNLAPGETSVVAIYKDSKKGAISSEVVYFTISDDSGAVSVPLISRGWIYGLLIFLAMAISITFTYWAIGRRGRGEAFFSVFGNSRISRSRSEPGGGDDTDGKIEKFFGGAESTGQVRGDDKAENIDATAVEVEHDLKKVSKKLRETMKDMDGLREEIDKKEEKAGRVGKEKAQKLRRSAQKVEEDLINVANEVNDTLEEVDKSEN